MGALQRAQVPFSQSTRTARRGGREEAHSRTWQGSDKGRGLPPQIQGCPLLRGRTGPRASRREPGGRESPAPATGTALPPCRLSPSCVQGEGHRLRPRPGDSPATTGYSSPSMATDDLVSGHEAGVIQGYHIGRTLLCRVGSMPVFSSAKSGGRRTNGLCAPHLGCKPGAQRSVSSGSVPSATRHGCSEGNRTGPREPQKCVPETQLYPPRDVALARPSTLSSSVSLRPSKTAAPLRVTATVAGACPQGAAA